MATGTSFAPDKRLRRAEARRVPFAAGGDPWPMNPPCSWTESKLSSSSASTQKSSPSSPHNGAAPAFLTSCSSPLITQVFIYSRPGGVQFLEDSCAYHAMNPLVRCRNRRARSFSIGTTMGNLTAVRVNDWKMVFLEQRSKGRSVWREPFSATANWPTPWGMDASRRIAARVRRGAISLSSSSHFALRPYSTP